MSSRVTRESAFAVCGAAENRTTKSTKRIKKAQKAISKRSLLCILSSRVYILWPAPLLFSRHFLFDRGIHASVNALHSIAGCGGLAFAGEASVPLFGGTRLHNLFKRHSTRYHVSKTGIELNDDID